MVYPTVDTSVDTAYGKKGSMWGCGWHDGVDFMVSTNTRVNSTWGGTVVEAAYPTSFGSAFGRSIVIDHDKLPDGSAGGWGLYAHLNSEIVSVGQRVEAGQQIGTSGNTGNSSGPHLHFGVYMNPYWSSGGGVNPQKWLDASVGGGGGGGGGWHYASGTQVYGKYLKYKGHEQNSDGKSVSIGAWQDMLNNHPLSGGSDLPITEQWFDLTAQETQKCQTQHIPPADNPLSAVFVGSKQFEHVRSATNCPYVWAG